jgi:hypothetical protein
VSPAVSGQHSDRGSNRLPVRFCTPPSRSPQASSRYPRKVDSRCVHKTRHSQAFAGLSTRKPQKNRTSRVQTPPTGSIYFNTTISSCFILDVYHMGRYFRLHPQLSVKRLHPRLTLRGAVVPQSYSSIPAAPHAADSPTKPPSPCQRHSPGRDQTPGRFSSPLFSLSPRSPYLRPHPFHPVLSSEVPPHHG